MKNINKRFMFHFANTKHLIRKTSQKNHIIKVEAITFQRFLKNSFNFIISINMTTLHM
jgi:hypothetical protein